MGLVELAAEEDFTSARQLRWTDRRHAEMMAVDVAIAVVRQGLPIVVAGGIGDAILGLAAESSTPESVTSLAGLIPALRSGDGRGQPGEVGQRAQPAGLGE